MMAQMAKISGNIVLQEVFRLMDMGCMIWPTTFGNGVKTGMIARNASGCCGVVIGATVLDPYG